MDGALSYPAAHIGLTPPGKTAKLHPVKPMSPRRLLIPSILAATLLGAQERIHTVTDVPSYGAFIQGLAEFCRPAEAMKAFQHIHRNCQSRFLLPTFDGVALDAPLQTVATLSPNGATNQILWLNLDNLATFKLQTGKCYGKADFTKAWLCWSQPKDAEYPPNLALGTLLGNTILSTRPIGADLAGPLRNALPPLDSNRKTVLRHHLISRESRAFLASFGFLRPDDLDAIKTCRCELEASPHQATFRIVLTSTPGSPLANWIRTTPPPTNFWRHIPRGVPLASILPTRETNGLSESAFYLMPDTANHRFSFKSFRKTASPAHATQLLDTFSKGDTNHFLTPLTTLGYRVSAQKPLTIDARPARRLRIQKENALVDTLPSFGLPVSPVRLFRQTDTLYATALGDTLVLASGNPESLMTAARTATLPGPDFRRRFLRYIPENADILAAGILQPTALLRHWIAFLPNSSALLQKLPDAGDDLAWALTRESKDSLALSIWLPQTEAFALQATFNRGVGVLQEVLMQYLFQEMMQKASTEQESEQ
ncbi:MAG: hypothetical protein ACI4QD_06335 [Kiritimatiellia bacterium]